MSGWVVGPILPALFLGKWLDSRFGMSPYLLVTSISIAFGVSCFGIVREAQKYITQEEKSELHFHE